MSISPTLTISTDRCRLRRVSEADIPHVFSATRFEGFNDGMLWDPPESLDELHEPLRSSLTAWDEGSAYCFSIDTKKEQTFVGRISIRRNDQDRVWNLGFWTHPNHQRQGYMTEVVPAVVDWGFTELNASRVEACSAIWNTASEKVLARNGFRFERIIPYGFRKHDDWVAERLMAISRPDWEAIRKTGSPAK